MRRRRDRTGGASQRHLDRSWPLLTFLSPFCHARHRIDMGIAPSRRLVSTASHTKNVYVEGTSPEPRQQPHRPFPSQSPHARSPFWPLPPRMTHVSNPRQLGQLFQPMPLLYSSPRNVDIMQLTATAIVRGRRSMNLFDRHVSSRPTATIAYVRLAVEDRGGPGIDRTGMRRGDRGWSCMGSLCVAGAVGFAGIDGPRQPHGHPHRIGATPARECPLVPPASPAPQPIGPSGAHCETSIRGSSDLSGVEGGE